MTTAQLQSHLITWWQLAHRGLGVSDARLLIAFPVEEERRGKVCPSLFLAVQRAGGAVRKHQGGLWLDLEREVAGSSPARRELHALLAEQGYAVRVAEEFPEAVECITRYLLEGR